MLRRLRFAVYDLLHAITNPLLAALEEKCMTLKHVGAENPSAQCG
jgi:hypothetical protein